MAMKLLEGDLSLFASLVTIQFLVIVYLTLSQYLLLQDLLFFLKHDIIKLL